MEVTDEEIKLFLDSIRSKSNYDFSNYSMNSLKRRVRKLLNDNHLEIMGLVDRISDDWSFMEKVVKSITVSTTEFFRDPSIWLSLQENIFPLFRSRKKITVWIPGCSTGQEVYSFIIMLHENGLENKTDIYATDINTDVLEAARKGIYKFRFNKDYLKNFDLVVNHDKSQKNIVPYSRYLDVDEKNDTITMKPFLTGKPSFSKSDLVTDKNPFNIKFDLVICRNVIIYFNYELQNRVLNLFHRHLSNTGWLILGIHESIIGPCSSHFEKKFNLYEKR